MTEPVRDLRLIINTDLGREEIAVADFKDASDSYRDYIERGDLGSSELGKGSGNIKDASGKVVARVSYNGNVWNPIPWTPEQKPILRVC